MRKWRTPNVLMGKYERTSKDNQNRSYHLLRERKGETSVELLERIVSRKFLENKSSR